MVIEKKQQIWMERRWKRTVNGKSRLVGEAGASWIDSKSREEGLKEEQRKWSDVESTIHLDKGKFSCQTGASDSLIYLVHTYEENFHVRPELSEF